MARDDRPGEPESLCGDGEAIGLASTASSRPLPRSIGAGTSRSARTGARCRCCRRRPGSCSRTRPATAPRPRRADRHRRHRRSRRADPPPDGTVDPGAVATARGRLELGGVVADRTVDGIRREARRRRRSPAAAPAAKRAGRNEKHELRPRRRESVSMTTTSSTPPESSCESRSSGISPNVSERICSPSSSEAAGRRRPQRPEQRRRAPRAATGAAARHGRARSRAR